MTGPKRHKRPPNQFRRRSLIIMAVFTTMVVALGVGTASAGLRGDRDGRDGWRNSSGRHGHNNGSQSADPSATTSADPSATTSGEPGETASADPSDTASADPSATDPGESQEPGEGEETEAPDNGVDETDYINIRQVPTTRAPRFARSGSRGSFNSIRCTLQDRHNSDNFIAAPGVVNAAHHVHDYVGNTTTDANSTDESLAAGGTTCNQGDKSAYFWPVYRDVTQETTPRFPGELEEDLNTGALLKPRFTIRFEGNPRAKVAAMPQNIRVLAGDAKAPVNGGANQRSAFTCQGFTNRISVDKYTLCPNGRGFTHISEFPSCWDGKNTDSANHRTHIVYPDAQGNCPASNPVVVPKLVITLVYNVKPGPTFRLDSFPESTHEPSTSHNDFFNLIPQNVMNRMVQCINTGRRC